MNGEREDKACLKMILGIIPKDMRSFPKQVQTHITDFTYSLKDPIFSKVSTPVNATVNTDFEMSDDSKVFFPTNIGALPPEMPDVQSMEVDLIDSDKSLTKCLPTSKENQFQSIGQELTLPISTNLSPETICSETVSVQCLESIASLEEKCKEEGLIFNSCDVEDGNYDLSIIFKLHLSSISCYIKFLSSSVYLLLIGF